MNRWYYESDGEVGARTHYAVCEDGFALCGIQRKDFDSAKEARAFIAAMVPWNPDIEPREVWQQRMLRLYDEN